MSELIRCIICISEGSQLRDYLLCTKSIEAIIPSSTSSEFNLHIFPVLGACLRGSKGYTMPGFYFQREVCHRVGFLKIGWTGTPVSSSDMS